MLITLMMFLTILNTNVEASTPDAPNIKTIKQLKKGDTILFSGIEWVVLEPTTGTIITRRPLTNLGLGIADATIPRSGYIANIEDLLNVTFYNKLHAEDREMLVTKDTWNENIYQYSYYYYSSNPVSETNKINTKPLKLFLPNLKDFNNHLYSLFYIDAYLGGDNYRFYMHTLDKANCNPYSWQEPRIEPILMGAEGTHNGSQTSLSMAQTMAYLYLSEYRRSYIYPKAFIDTNAKVFTNNTNDIVVVGGSVKLNGSKGVTNKFYYYDRYESISTIPIQTHGFYWASGTTQYWDKILEDRHLNNYEEYGDSINKAAQLRNQYVAQLNTIHTVNAVSISRRSYTPSGPRNRTGGEKFYLEVWLGTDSGYYNDNEWIYHTLEAYGFSYGYSGSPTFARGQLVGTYFLGQDKNYPINGVHTDGYWYVRKSEANIDGLGEVSVDSLSVELKKDIMPIVVVTVNKPFDEVLQGRGYIANLAKFNNANGNYTVYRQNNDYINVKGTFTSTGVYFTSVTDTNGKVGYILFNVIPNPVQGSASGVSF